MTEETRSTYRAILWTALLLAVIAGFLWQFVRLSDAKERLNSVPLIGKNFIGQKVPLVDWEKEFFRNVTLIKRLYRVGDNYLFVTALDGTNNRHAVHDPLYCFRGGGWKVLDQKTIPLGGGTASLVDLEKDGNNQQAIYWFSDGTKPFHSPLTYWLTTTLRRLTLGASGEEPVMIVVQPISGSSLDLEDLQQRMPELINL